MTDMTERGIWLTADDDGGQLDDPDLRHVFDYWRRAAGDRDAPRRCDIDPPIDLPSYLPTMVIFDVERGEDGGLVLRYRLLGTRLVEFAGQDFRGKTMAEALGDEVVAADNAIYERVVTDRTCYCGERRSMIHVRQAFERYIRLLMPVLGNESDEVAFLWCWLKFPGTPPQLA